MEIQIPANKKIYFASDFHLGAPNFEKSRERELAIVAWLDEIKTDAAHVFLMGDVFDFWFEYKHVVPKGFIRFLGKLAELSDAGIQIHWFIGNHDMWIYDYFVKELNIKIHYEPVTAIVNGEKLFLAHGDGLGPGDYVYKLLKLCFSSKVLQWCFSKFHPNLSLGIGYVWSGHSRKVNHVKDEEFFGEKERLYQFAKGHHQQFNEIDYYLMGHRHLAYDLPINNTARIINLGGWVREYTYACFDGEKMELLVFPGKTPFITPY